MKVYRSEIGWNTNDWRTIVPTCNVVEMEPLTKFSGLLDANGNKLMVTVQSEPAGFVIFPERKAVPEPPAPTAVEKGGVPRW